MKPMKNLIYPYLSMVFLVGLAIYLVYGEGSEHIIKAKTYAAYAGLILLGIGSVILLRDENALRDSCALKKDKPYSFSRVQMWWWTLIILGAFLGIYAVSGNQWVINSTCLVLLGISSVTTASGRMIDNQQTNDINITRHQDLHPSEGFMKDILSDENGLSIHRFQALIINVAYGLSFIAEVFSKANDPHGQFPVYDNTVLGLLTLSSGTYLYIKMNESQTTQPVQSENTVKAVEPTRSSNQNDVLPDVDNSIVHPSDN